MKIRFLQTTPSMNPDVPFQAGQVIDVESPTAEMLSWLRQPLGDGSFRAAVVQAHGDEAAIVRAPERAVRPRPRGRAA